MHVTGIGADIRRDALTTLLYMCYAVLLSCMIILECTLAIHKVPRSSLLLRGSTNVRPTDQQQMLLPSSDRVTNYTQSFELYAVQYGWPVQPHELKAKRNHART